MRRGGGRGEGKGREGARRRRNCVKYDKRKREEFACTNYEEGREREGGEIELDPPPPPVSLLFFGGISSSSSFLPP